MRAPNKKIITQFFSCLVCLVTVREEEISAQEREKRKGKRYEKWTRMGKRYDFIYIYIYIFIFIYIFYSMSVRMKGEKEKGRLTINNLTVYPNYKFR